MPIPALLTAVFRILTAIDHVGDPSANAFTTGGLLSTLGLVDLVTSANGARGFNVQPGNGILWTMAHVWAASNVERWDWRSHAHE